jgi:ABC-2 type transport system ATP-binding protein
VTTVGQIAIGNLLSGYCDQIERLIGEANYRDAFANLQDFIRDFSPGKKRNVLALCSRYHRWREAQSLGLPEPDNINVIVHACLDLVDDVRREFPDNGARAQPDRPDGVVASEPDVISSAPLIDVTPNRPTTVPAVALSAVAVPALAGPVEGRGNSLTLEQSRHSYFNNWRKTQHTDNFVVFQCRDLARKYEQGSFRLGPISLELRAGEITAIVGRNASGKTTFLRLMNGELRPDSGHMTYPMLQSVGDDWLTVKSKVAFVPQLPERWHGRLRDNLNFVAATYGARGVTNRELVDWQLARYGLEEYENAQWDEISGGYKIRFELARALVAQPKLLLLDEPLAYLDVITRQRFLIDLRAIASSLENPIPIVVTSQHLYEIEAIADQLVILDDGKCAFAGRLDDLARYASRVVIEISLKAAKSDVAECMKDFGLEGIEETIEGYILVLPNGTSHEALFTTMRRRFGDELYSYRDISRSTRSLMCETPALAALLASNPEAKDVDAPVRV